MIFESQSVTKMVCVKSLKGWEKVVTPGKIYEFNFYTYKIKHKSTTITYTYFIGDDGNEHNYANLCISNMTNYFITLEEYRQNQLNTILE